MGSRKRVLFVCEANAARSLMAEAILRYVAGEFFEVQSAGLHPTRPHPLALESLRLAGVPTEGLHSKPLSEVEDGPFDLLITLCDKSAGERFELPGDPPYLRWDFSVPPEPVLADFQRLVHELSERLHLFVTLTTERVGVQA